MIVDFLSLPRVKGGVQQNRFQV